jgi:DNA-binding CsgD family transcriptional regulator
MTFADAIELGREASTRQAWADAFDGLSAAERTAPLELEDLERLAIAAHMLGRRDDAIRTWERAHHAAVRADDPISAARYAFHIVMGFGERGDFAQAGGWHARATRLLDDAGQDSVERGYLLVPEALRALGGGDAATAHEIFGRASAIADQFGDPDLATLGRLGRGQALIAMSQTGPGVALLDEAMVAVTGGEVTPIYAGIVYCAAIEAFQSLFDLRRAQEWTTALSRWCEAQPDLVPFRGRCLVYRAEIMRFHGRWQEAVTEAGKAREWLSRPPPEAAVGEAFYQQAELHRLRGEIADAEHDYREASQWGRRPEPGLALLRLAQGRLKAATAAIRRAVDEAADEISRASLLEPQVEIALAAGDLATAREAADGLARVADIAAAPLLTAIARRAEGAVLLAEGDARAALGTLRSASDLWQQLDAPYEMARVRVWIGLALRRLGDADSAELEYDAARRVFGELDAAPDLARLDALSMEPSARAEGLSARELEVLQLLAAGRTNRSIADELGISERTVDRHVSNIFTKLDVTSRSAATAYAYEHGIR